ncbi:UDPglucose 6-dehydrogenase [Lutibacter sp. Hel_I_33_5]|uniref:UDP-glucose dehydrogenase family protein n=1 Tax=Lutibacter sp. Hel_I_33_5 TaxID=1566289 RepID=UPI00119EC805|nr:UDP-glucose/GDP-mannose dehydrogenase family protein [Lutibacter sp. Hel_I_33_5]TVZ55518.1 UDPglucose 6-dehydrogenase [Lutibacter sp. Hel_I_33_5]
MNVTIIGSGYVGLTSGACFAEMGNKVVCVDVDKNKVNDLKKGIIPIFEPGLENLVSKNLNKTLFFSSEFENSINSSDIIFIAVGTPMSEDGSADLKYVKEVAKEIGKNLQKDIIIVNKSTVPVGTADIVKGIIKKELALRNVDFDFFVVSNPEFLKEGTAITDFMKPDRVVIGADSEKAFKKMEQLYSPFFRTHDRFIRMDIRSAEMTKYAANTMLATKISFINEIANICEKVGADVNKVRIGIGSDSRIGYNFIYPGTGYGGACFPKDVRALNKIALENGYKTQLISSVEKVNNEQRLIIARKVVNRFGDDLSDMVFTIWGLAFKPGTDDVREAPAIYVIKELIKKGAKINAYDPKAMKNTKDVYLNNVEGISYFKSKYEALNNSNGLILMTEWKEFRSPDFEEIKKLLIEPIVFDGRNQYSVFNLEEKGFEYYQIGKQ